MKSFLLRLYDKSILEKPVLSLFVTLAVIGFFIVQIPNFKLDASADTLVLEKDQALRYHRQITERYGTNEVLVITYSPKEDLFTDSNLEDLTLLRDQLRQVQGVESVVTILDVPLLYSADVSLTDLAGKGKIETLEHTGIDRSIVRKEFSQNPLYRNRLLSADGTTTSLLVVLPIDEEHRGLLHRRTELREKQYDGILTSEETTRLHDVTKAFSIHCAEQTKQQNQLVADIRRIMDQHRDRAQLYLGGVPMIVADMIDFIENDIVVFGIGVFLFLLITLAIIFKKIRWVLLPMLCCLAAGLTMIGYLGQVDWRVTVISSNFISLMLIFTMSLTIHLIVRYRELHAQLPEADHRFLVRETVRLKTIPCFYTTLTTIVAFTSLLVSDIRPVMDFGLMMTVGLIVSFLLSFVLFPAGLLLLRKDTPQPVNNPREPFTLIFARITESHGGTIVVLSLLLTVISAMGITRLNVENRFIDYFRDNTEIHQGMTLIDRKLGGTTPLDLIIDFKEAPPEQTHSDPEGSDDEFEEDLLDDFEEALTDTPWFVSTYRMEEIEKIHDYLLELPEIGEVLSIATAMKIAAKLNNGFPLENFEIALLHQKSPEDIRELLIAPYLSEDIPQARIAIRTMESKIDMQRKALLAQIRHFLTTEMGFSDDQIHFTNMFVLYNNMLQSLFKSQILTIGMVFLGIMLMFMILFRSFSLACIAIIPNLLPAAMVLGTMGWLGIPLDMMTITIAAITIGIAVDDTIHYMHRFVKEFEKDRNYLTTMYRCHASIGKAMYYTSITIVLGFSILVMSNFIPTIYFGLFTGFAMLVALLAALTLLPQLLILFKPLGPETKK
ncbi:RND family transporter [Thermodesulfobacteriota bacterium]